MKGLGCTVHGRMAYDPATDTYTCPCLTVTAAEMAPYFAIAGDPVLWLTPPARSER